MNSGPIVNAIIMEKVLFGKDHPVQSRFGNFKTWKIVSVVDLNRTEKLDMILGLENRLYMICSSYGWRGHTTTGSYQE